MNKTAILKELKALGTEQTLKTYRRHQITGPAFGVRYGDMYKLQKKVGVDTKLAAELFATGNHDARVLAFMIADPAELKVSTLDSWVKTVDNQLTVDGVAGLAARHPKAADLVKKWVKLKDEWQAATGWHAVGALAAQDDVPDALFDGWLKTIERDLQKSANRVRHSMNGALIGIGARSAAFEKKAIAVAKKVGEVVVDHGQTSCKTPDAVAYIHKMAAYNRQKAEKAAKKASAQKAAPKKAAKKAVSKKAATQKKTAQAVKKTAARKAPAKKKPAGRKQAAQG